MGPATTPRKRAAWSHHRFKRSRRRRTRRRHAGGLSPLRSSTIVKANGAAAAGSGLSLVWLIDQYGPTILEWLRRAAEDPDTIDKLQSGVAYVSGSSAMPMLATGLAGALIAILGVSGFSIFKRMRMYQTGVK